MLIDGGADIARSARQLSLPRLPDLGSTKDKEGGGFTVEFAVKLESNEGGQTLIDARDANGNGFAVSTTDRGTVQLALRGALGPSSTGSFSTDVRDFGLGEISWDCDPGLLKAGEWHHCGIIVDGGPKTISFVVDGKLNDGGDRRQFGWARFPRELRTINATDRVTLAPRIRGEMRQLRIYDRALRTSEVVGNWRAGTGGK